MGLPVKVSAVDDDAAHARCVTVHIFGGRVDNDVGTPFKRATIYGRGECVVDNQGHTLTVGYAGKLFDVKHLERGVGYRFAKERLGVGTESGYNLLLACVGLTNVTSIPSFFIVTPNRLNVPP